MPSSCSTVRRRSTRRSRRTDIGPALAGIGLALSSALVWGSADFSGGTLSRRAPAIGVVFGGQLVGAALAFVVAVARTEPIPGPSDLLIASVGGIFALVGILCLYQGLAVGRMSIVAPVTGVLGASIPVVAGAVIHGAPGGIVIVGFVLAVVAVALVTRTAADDAGKETGLRLAIIAGISIGIFGVFLGSITDGLVAGPLAVIRVVEAALIVVVVAVARRPWQVARPLWAGVAFIGVLDVLGNMFFIASIQTYRLDVAAALSSLYPVVTVVIASMLGHERIGGVRWLGIATAGLAIVLIAGGT